MIEWLCDAIFGHSYLKLHKAKNKPQRLICSRCAHIYTAATLSDMDQIVIGAYRDMMVRCLNEPNRILEALAEKRGPC